jgi:23S rRNA U2552 (ribose-2'-O)-methylase RlmE/FtsJ
MEFLYTNYIFSFKDMDPSASICISYDSLKVVTPLISRGLIDVWYFSQEQTALTSQFETLSIDSATEPKYCDTNRYTILQHVKDAFESENFIRARDDTNPFEAIGLSIFINRAAVKLANIDAVHNVSGEIFTFDSKTSAKQLKFCDIAAGPGGFTQYLQYRFPKSKGYGMTLKHNTLDWRTSVLDMSRFNPFYGPDNSGNLYTNWNNFIDFVLEKEPRGVDLITADGGFDLDDNIDKTILHRQEFLSSRLLLTQAVIGVTCVKIGGNFVVKVFDTVTEISSQILFVLAQCFHKILIFKPVSSRPENAERYVICINRKPDVTSYSKLLSGAAKAYTDKDHLNRIFTEPISQIFSDWLTNSNNRSIDLQLQTARDILLYMDGTSPTIATYDIPKFLTIWNLPDTPINPKTTRIK